MSFLTRLIIIENWVIMEEAAIFNNDEIIIENLQYNNIVCLHWTMIGGYCRKARKQSIICNHKLFILMDELEQADEFNGQFTDVFNKNEHSQVPLPNRSAPFMNDIVVSAVGVTKLLKGLNPSKALGPDELHPRVLKELASELGPVFCSPVPTIY